MIVFDVYANPKNFQGPDGWGVSANGDALGDGYGDGYGDERYNYSDRYGDDLVDPAGRGYSAPALLGLRVIQR